MTKINAGFFVGLENSGSPSFSSKRADFREPFRPAKNSARKVVRVSIPSESEERDG